MSVGVIVDSLKWKDKKKPCSTGSPFLFTLLLPFQNLGHILPTMQLTQSLEAVYQITCSFPWSHKRLYTTFFLPVNFNVWNSCLSPYHRSAVPWGCSPTRWAPVHWPVRGQSRKRASQGRTPCLPSSKDTKSERRSPAAESSLPARTCSWFSWGSWSGRHQDSWISSWNLFERKSLFW